LLHLSGKLNERLFLRTGRNLQIGGITFVISADPSIRLRVLNPLCRPFIVCDSANDKNTSISIHLKNDIWPRLDRQEKIFDTQDSWSIYRDGSNFWLCLAPVQHDKPLWIARFVRKVSRVTLYCQSLQPGSGRKKIVDLPLVYPLDQLLLMHFLATRKGILTHAAGIARGGKAFLFPGASGAGKSTFAQLLAEAGKGRLLSDERMIVREVGGELRAFGTPWAGTAGIARNGSAPLAGIYFLKHGPNDRMKKLAAADALDRLLPVVSVPWYDPETATPIVAFAKRLASEVPAYEMSFTPERPAVDFFWQFLKTASRSN
jgi:hypothetical protein